MGHATMENRHGLAVAGTVTFATGTAERRASEIMLKAKAKKAGRRITVGTPPADCLRGLLVGRSLVEFALRYCQVLIELAKPRQIAGGQLHPRRGMTAGPEEEIALLMRRWEQVKAGDGAVVLIGGEPGNREIAPRAAAHRVAEARRIVANQSSRSIQG